jgi:NTE family protein
MYKIVSLLIIEIFYLFLFSPIAKAQEMATEEVKRPKIGLVLSGGGAKGMAHVGVLKVLEELGIRPDYISGVSMGSIVGGLYSLGYSAHELDSLVKVIDWNAVFSDELSFNQIGYNVKQDYRNYQLNLSGNSIKEIGLPLGVVGGQVISELFSELCWRSTGIDSFDDFPIPFRCTAADIISGKSIVFNSGSLAQAMRASMAIPTVFTPVIQGEMLLVDGGVINNFPVQECIDMGADILIGVYVGSDENAKANDFKTMLEVLSHSASFMGVLSSREQMRKLDIKITPNVDDYGIESFGKSDVIIDLGEAAARDEEVYGQLKALANSLKAYPARKNKRLPFMNNELSLGKICVLGLEHTSKDFIIAISELEEYSVVTNQEVNAAIKRLYRTLIFDKIEYRLVKHGDLFDLVFVVVEEDKIHLNASVYYDNFFGAGLLLNASYKHLLVNSSKLDLIIDISKYSRASLNYSIIGGERKRLLFSLGVNMQSIVIPNFYEFDNSLIVSLGQFRNDQFCFNTRLGYSISTNSKIEFKGSYVTNYFRLQGGLEDMYGIKTVSSNNFAIEGAYKLNTLDHPIFPTKGAKLEIVYRKIINPQSSYSASEGLFEEISTENQIVVIDYKHYYRIGNRFSIIPEFTLGYMSSIPFYADKFFLGGSGFNTRLNTFNQAGVQPYKIATDNFLKLGFGMQLKINANWYVNAFSESAFFINHAETYSEESLRLDGETIYGWVASIGYNSVLGPLKITVSQNNNNSKYYYYFSFGFPL